MAAPGNSQPESKDGTKFSPFRVLGIALVAERMGAGARMIFRYPTAPLAGITEDLFFQIPPHQLAKLFRPKPALCGQPMTLSVGGTVFCCRAVLMEDNPEAKAREEDMNTTTTENKNSLHLFSVIVALAPQVRTSSIPIAGWFEGNTEEQPEKQSHLHHSLAMLEGKLGPSSTGSRASASFLSVRSVHVSLARLCRVLEREERRCRYVSLQTDLFQTIRNDMERKLDEQHKAASSSMPPSATNSPASLHHKKPSHKRHNSLSGPVREIQKALKAKESNLLDSQQQEWEQQLTEIFIAAAPPTNTENDIQHQGNLVRECLQVYHALARNDHDFPPSPSLLLTGRDGVVYINRHIAVAIEAVSPYRMAPTECQPVIRPYHTLLFHHASPSELLESLSIPGSAAPRRLQQLLLTVNPQKSLNDISTDANLPLTTTMEIAAYLANRGVCLASPVLSRNSRLACWGIDKIQDMSLRFSQTFGSSLNMFVLVSFLSDPKRTLGEAMAAVGDSNDSDAVWLRECLEASLGPRRTAMSENGAPSPTDNFVESPMGVQTPDDLEERLYQIALWLVSHKVLVQQEDYLVSLPSNGGSETIDESTSHHTECKSDPNLRFDNLTDDLLYKELVESDCLGGKVSMQACSWRTSLNINKLCAFALRHDLIRIISRVPTAGDDWGAVQH
jgi:hypothetical protein